MTKKMITGLKVLAFACSALLLVAACAKKQIQAPPTPYVSPYEDVVQTKPDTSAETESEAVRQARLEELEKQKSQEDMGPNTIYFDYDRSDLSAEAQSILKKIAAILRSNPSYSLDISGHCDERGTIEYNLALGERRARSAKKFLSALGISEDRVSTISYGEEKPVDSRSTEEAWAQNRRDEFVFIK